MLLNRFKNASIQSILVEATALKKRGFYAAAKHLIRLQLEQHPQHEELNALYRRIEQLQQVKVDRRHRMAC